MMQSAQHSDIGRPASWSAVCPSDGISARLRRLKLDNDKPAAAAAAAAVCVCVWYKTDAW